MTSGNHRLQERLLFSEEGRILIEFGEPMKLVRLIKMCLNGTYSKVHIGKHLSQTCPIQNGLNA
jgi:hypothetical protein